MLGRFLFFYLCAFTCLKGQVWLALPDFPAARRDDGVAVAVGNTAYFGTGLIEWSLTIDFYALDLAAKTWTSIPDMPHGAERQYACAFAGPGCFYVFGGDGVGGALSNLYKYDIASKTWAQAASKPGAGLIGAACLPFGNNVLIIGGKLQSTGPVSREVWEYDITANTWAQKNNTPFTGRWRASAAVLNGFGYLLFGIDSAGSYRKELFRYDRGADTWVKVSDFPSASGRAYAAMQSASNKLFVFSGTDSTGTFYNDAWYYNPLANTWSPGNNLPAQARRGGMHCEAAGNFYFSCGLGASGRLTETWMTDVPLAIIEEKGLPEIKLFPLPAADVLNVIFPESSPCRVVITDLLGHALPLEVNTYNGYCELNVRPLPPGIYQVLLYSGECFKGSAKFIKADP